MQALIAESSCTQVKKQGKKHKFKKPWMTQEIFKVMQQRENYRKKVKDEPFNSKLSEKFSNITSCLEVDGQIILSPKEISECFNNFFSNIGSGLADKLPATNTDPLSYLSRLPHDERFDFLEVSPIIIDEVIENSSSKKAVGYDGVSMALIKDNRQALSPILAHL